MSRRAAARLLIAALAAALAVDSGAGVALASGHHHHHGRHHHARHHHPHIQRHRNHLAHRLARHMPSGVHVRRFYDHPTHSVVHVAAIRPGAPVRFRAVPAGLPVRTPQLRRTSSMCHRVHCLVAVNGSFRDLPSRLPRGAEVIGGTPVKMHAREPRQAVFSPRRPLQIGSLRTDIRLGQDGVGSISLESVNLDPGRSGIALFTPRYGTWTPHGLSVRLTLSPGEKFVVGRTESVHVGPLRRGARHLFGDRRPVLVARGWGAHRLRRLLRLGDRRFKMQLTSTSPVPNLQTLGTSFRILRNGHVNISHPHWRFVRGHEPRTLLASRPNGTVLLITVDGRWRRHSIGATMRQAALLARRLGAMDAVNMDGGGSTTFVMRGHVVNRPSDGRERGVSNALALVLDRSQPFDPHYLWRLHAARRAARRAEARQAAAARARIVVVTSAARIEKVRRIVSSLDDRGELA